MQWMRRQLIKVVIRLLNRVYSYLDWQLERLCKVGEALSSQIERHTLITWYQDGDMHSIIWVTDDRPDFEDVIEELKDFVAEVTPEGQQVTLEKISYMTY